MNIGNAKGKPVSKILAQLKENEGNISILIKDIGEHLKNSGESNTVADALRWAENMLGKSPIIKDVNANDGDYLSNYAVAQMSDKILHRGLRNYLNTNRIAGSLAANYLNEAIISDKKTKKKFTAFIFRNENCGYQLINQNVSGAITKVGITFIRGKIYKPKGLHIFKNMLDFLSLLSYKKINQFDEDSIILNSFSNLTKVTPYIKGYGYKYICCWLEDTLLGSLATTSIKEFIETEIGTRFHKMVPVYKQHISLFNWHLNYSDNPSS